MSTPTVEPRIGGPENPPTPPRDRRAKKRTTLKTALIVVGAAFGAIFLLAAISAVMMMSNADKISDLGENTGNPPAGAPADPGTEPDPGTGKEPGNGTGEPPVAEEPPVAPPGPALEEFGLRNPPAALPTDPDAFVGTVADEASDYFLNQLMILEIVADPSLVEYVVLPGSPYDQVLRDLIAQNGPASGAVAGKDSYIFGELFDPVYQPLGAKPAATDGVHEDAVAFSYELTRADGSTATMSISIAPNDEGQWLVYEVSQQFGWDEGY